MDWKVSGLDIRLWGGGGGGGGSRRQRYLCDHAHPCNHAHLHHWAFHHLLQQLRIAQQLLHTWRTTS